MRDALFIGLLGLLPALVSAAGTGPVPAARAAATPKPVIERAWARATSPGVNVTAAYFTIRNPAPKADQVVTLRSPAA